METASQEQLERWLIRKAKKTERAGVGNGEGWPEANSSLASLLDITHTLRHTHKKKTISTDFVRVLANERPPTTLFTREKCRSPIHKLRATIFYNNDKSLSVYIIKRKDHGKCLVQFLFTRCFVS